MRAWGNPSIQKIMFAHIALLGFQRAGGTVRRFRHDHYFTPHSRFCKRGKTIFSEWAMPKAFYKACWFHNELILFPLQKNIREFI
ncbi:MAG: hypothetical protein K6G44_16020 [Lentisphaeria bacterium]|nr:hypothetical protein [Lentisphaeria bacterium]